MLNDGSFPTIQPMAVNQEGNPNHQLCTQAIKNALQKILSELNGYNGTLSPREEFLSLMPLVKARGCNGLPGTISIYAITKKWTGAFKFFFDMINNWLVPRGRLNLGMIYAVDFCIPEIGEEVYTLCEAVICVENKRELDQILHNLPVMESELKMGLASSHYARRILEVKGFSNDEKTALIQEHIAYLMDHRPRDFDQDALTEMQHVLLICREDFKEARDCRHLSRIVGIHYLFRKGLREAVKKSPGKRHIKLKLFRSRIYQGDSPKRILGVLIGVNFIRDKEVLDKAHVMHAIQQYVPHAKAIENSFFANRRGSEPICTMYLEIEKDNREEFTSKEIQLLRRELPNDLKSRIKHLLHPVFMPRNEEETIRNILSLSSQIKYLRDIPQVFISFDEQTHANLFFTVILVRVARPENIPIQEMFKNTDTCLEYIHDRSQNAGSLRRKYKKEATVFRVKLSKDQFLRSDHTIDLNKARQTVVAELFNIVGDIRDFNGGMISKQNEIFTELKALLEHDVKYSDLILENFFYSLTPVIMRNVLEPEALRTLFLMHLNSIDDDFKENETCTLKIINDDQFVFSMIKCDDRSIRDELFKAISKLQLHSSQLATSFVSVNEVFYLGYIYRSDDSQRQRQFAQVIHQVVSARVTKKALYV